MRPGTKVLFLEMNPHSDPKLWGRTGTVSTRHGVKPYHWIDLDGEPFNGFKQVLANEKSILPVNLVKVKKRVLEPIP